MSEWRVEYYPDEKVDHEEHVEREVDLLGGTIGPLLTRLHRLTTIAHTDMAGQLSLPSLTDTHAEITY